MPLFPWPLFPRLVDSEGSSLWPSPTSVFANKGCPLVFPLVIYGCESWIIKKDERRRTDAFEVWCWRRLFRVPWTARSHQLILKEINPEYSLEGLMLKLNFENFDYLMQRADSLEKTLMLGKIEGRRRRGWQRMRWLDGKLMSMDWVWANFRMVKDREAWCAAVHGFAKSRTGLSDLTTITTSIWWKTSGHWDSLCKELVRSWLWWKWLFFFFLGQTINQEY